MPAEVAGRAIERDLKPANFGQLAIVRGPPVTRGRVVPLTDAQIVKRALYLAGKAKLGELDEHVRPVGPPDCPTIYYLLEAHNGGKDPTAPDPADRWSAIGSTQINVTCDCSGGNSWMHGFDRFQPQRMRPSVGYSGWFNTDSKILDVKLPLAKGETRCFEVTSTNHHRGVPTPGAILTCASGSPGHKIGHEACVVAYHGAEWDPDERACWDLIDVVDVSAQGYARRANLQRTGRGWYGTNAWFLRSVMQP